MKIRSTLIIASVVLFCGCSTEPTDPETTDTSMDLSLSDVGGQDLEEQQCDGLEEAVCLKSMSCEWYAMQEVAFENDVCVAGAKVNKCAPASGTQAFEVFINGKTKAAVISPAGGFGDSWGSWEGCETKEQTGVCLCSGCLGKEPGNCDI